MFKTMRTIVEMPDLTQDDALVETLGDNLHVSIPQKRDGNSKLAAVLGPAVKEVRIPLMKKTRV
ncbi:hypothetical protein CEB3_c05920 [Peptococcaceae bacterium CEB3]|nr:hypothetical protein CEB3_c05920 [Peptococcaceae bacterium CEB3]